MASNYPGSLDSFDTIASDKKTSDAVGGRTHRQMHNDLGDAIEAVQSELGTNPSGSDATVAARLTAIEAGTNLATGAVTSAKIADDAVGTSEIAANAVGSSELADNAVDTAAIADAAVTAAKLAVQPGNLLTDNQASGTDTLSATTGFAIASGSGALASSTAQYASGARSLAWTVAGTADEQMAVTPDPYAPADFIAVSPGVTITALFRVKSSAAEPISPRIYWYNGTSYVSAVIGATFTSSTSAWATVTVTGAAPAGCDRMVVIIQRTSGAAGSVHYFDEFSLHRGAGGLWAMPGEPIPGQSRIAVNNAVDLSGTGTPEGVVTAAPGSTWLQTDATTDVKGWIKWVKATGTGNTGWVAGPEADTGWRDVSASLVNSWSGAAAVKMRRIGERVTVRFAALVAGTTNDVMVVPAGFRPADRTVGWTAVIPNSVPFTDAPIAVSVLSSSQSPAHGLQLDYTKVPGYGLYSSTLWPTDETWPSSLPGSAV